MIETTIGRTCAFCGKYPGMCECPGALWDDKSAAGATIQPYPPLGWICPRCNSVYSPDTPECARCNGLGDFQDMAARVKPPGPLDAYKVVIRPEVPRDEIWVRNADSAVHKIRLGKDWR